MNCRLSISVGNVVDACLHGKGVRLTSYAEGGLFTDEIVKKEETQCEYAPERGEPLWWQFGEVIRWNHSVIMRRGRNAFKGIHKKAIFKVPKKAKKKYKSKLNKKSEYIKKTMKIQ